MGYAPLIGGETGFVATFKNGWRVSVQWGKDLQCSGDAHNAEVFVWHDNGRRAVWDNKVYSYQAVENIARILARVAKRLPK